MIVVPERVSCEEPCGLGRVNGPCSGATGGDEKAAETGSL